MERQIDSEPRLPSPNELDGLVLASMQLAHSEEMVAYRVEGGVDVMRFIETGETDLRSVQVGKGGPTYSREVHVWEPLIDRTFDTITDYVASLKRKKYSPDPTLRQAVKNRQVHDDQFDKFRDDLVELAQELSLDLEDEPRLDTCTNCNGEHREYDCFLCMQGGSAYIADDGEVIQERPKGEADPECTMCGGSGRHSPDCPICKGVGDVVINPIVTLINDETEVRSGFRLDVVRLIAQGAVSLAVKENTYRLQPGEEPKVTVSVDFVDALKSHATDIGINLKKDDVHALWGRRPLEMWGTTFGHLLKGTAEQVARSEAETITQERAREVFRKLQRNSWRLLRGDTYGLDREHATDDDVREHQRTFDLELDEEMQIQEYGLRLSKLKRPSEALNEIITLLDQYGYRLGFTYSFIATEESGPALYVLDRAGNVMQEIDSGYDAKYVLENTRRILTEEHAKGTLRSAGSELEE